MNRAETASKRPIKISVKKQNPDNKKLTFFSGNGDYADFVPMQLAPRYMPNSAHARHSRRLRHGEHIDGRADD
jgi:hypothetical protein